MDLTAIDRFGSDPAPNPYARRALCHSMSTMRARRLAPRYTSGQPGLDMPYMV